MLLKSFLISKEDGRAMYDKHWDYICMVDGTEMHLWDRSIATAVIMGVSTLGYDPSKCGLLVELSDCFIYTHINYGATYEDISIQMSVMARLLANCRHESSVEEFFENDTPIKLNTNRVLFKAVSADNCRVLKVGKGDDLWLDLSERTLYKMTLQGLIDLVITGKTYSGGLELSEHAKFELIVNTVDTPVIIRADTGDAHIEATLDEYLSLFDGMQYECDNMVLINYIKDVVIHYHSHMVGSNNRSAYYSSHATEDRDFLLDGDIRVIKGCPFFASAILHMCSRSSYRSLAKMAEDLPMLSSALKDGRTQVYMYLRDIIHSNPDSKRKTLRDLLNIVDITANKKWSKWSKWERSFFHYLENHVRGLEQSKEAPIYQILLHRDVYPQNVDTDILWSYIKLLYTDMGSLNVETKNYHSSYAAAALMLQMEYPGGELCLVNNDIIMYRDVRGILYKPASYGSIITVQVVEIPTCAFRDEVVRLYYSSDLSEPCGLACDVKHDPVYV